MDTALRPHFTFHLTSRRLHAEVAGRIHDTMRPALLARYRDLRSLRYDFPLVLVEAPHDPTGDRAREVQALSALVDAALDSLAASEGLERIARHAYRAEAEIRAMLAEGMTGSLSALWDRAAERLGAPQSAVRESLRVVRHAIDVDGAVLDCSETAPAAVVTHLWRRAQRVKASAFHARVDRLVFELSEILRADHVNSDAGRSAGFLHDTVAGQDRLELDFDVWSRTIRSAKYTPISESRRARIERLIAVLEAQRFFPIETGADAAFGVVMPHAFVFASAAAALDAYRARSHELVELAGALTVGRLEADGDFREDVHADLFEQWNAGRWSLGNADASLFPDYLVVLNAAAIDPVERAALTTLLTSNLPMTVLLVTDDLLDQEPLDDERLSLGNRNWQFVHIALGAGDVHVVQITASQLVSQYESLRASVRATGTALLSVFSGASPGTRHLPCYVTAAAALESRAFPAIAYDPLAAPAHPKLSVDANPQPTADWPVHEFAYDRDGHTKASETVAFTLADFAVCDSRCADHYADLSPSGWTGPLIPIAEHLNEPHERRFEQLPYVLAVDADHVLHRLVVDDSLLRETARCQRRWRVLTELVDRHAPPAEPAVAEPAPTAAAAPADAAPAAPAVPATLAADRSSDDPYIETPRCSTCNECTQINNRMFAYNENKQAYIANPKAGTYAQLVEAAESCQVSIIHPGKPMDVNEPGLEDLIRRAEAFR